MFIPGKDVHQFHGVLCDPVIIQYIIISYIPCLLYIKPQPTSPTPKPHIYPVCYTICYMTLFGGTRCASTDLTSPDGTRRDDQTGPVTRSGCFGSAGPENQRKTLLFWKLWVKLLVDFSTECQQILWVKLKSLHCVETGQAIH